MMGADLGRHDLPDPALEADEEKGLGKHRLPFWSIKKTGRSKDRTGFTHEKTPSTSAGEEIRITIYQTIQRPLYPNDRPALFVCCAARLPRVRSAHRPD
jgi:hypothetical protein